MLGIDLGTSSVKAVVTDAAGQMLSVASAEYPVVVAQPGWAEPAPEDWWEAVGSVVRQSVAQAGTSDIEGPLAPKAIPVAEPRTGGSEFFWDGRGEFHRVIKALRRRGKGGPS